MKRIQYIIAMLLLSFYAKAQQDTIYFDSTMNQVKKRSARKESAIIQNEENGYKVVNFYTLDGKQIRSSRYKEFGKQPDKQILHGPTSYKFSNSDQDSLLVSYSNNERNGGAFFYYPSGKIMTNCQFKNGLLNGPLLQFYEDGKTKRTEVYQNNRSISGKYLAPDSTELAFTPFYKAAEFAAGESELFQLFANKLRLPIDLIKDMSDKKQYGASATVGVVVNADGQAIDIVVLRTDNPKYNESSFTNVLKALKGKPFISREIDGKKITTMTVLSSPVCCAISAPSTSITYQK